MYPLPSVVGDIAPRLEAGSRWSDTPQSVGRSAQRHDARARGGLCWSEAPEVRDESGGPPTLRTPTAIFVFDIKFSTVVPVCQRCAGRPARRRAVGVLGSSGAVPVADSEISSFSQSGPGVLLAGGLKLERAAA